jgi:hypothetical protein
MKQKSSFSVYITLACSQLQSHQDPVLLQQDQENFINPQWESIEQFQGSKFMRPKKSTLLINQIKKKEKKKKNKNSVLVSYQLPFLRLLLLISQHGIP